MRYQRLWRVSGLILPFCLAFSLVACGSSASTQPPQQGSYIYSGQDGVALIVWQGQGNGTLTGRYTYNGTGQGVIGQYQKETYTFHFALGVLLGKAHGGTLSMPVALQAPVSTWYAGTQSDYNQLYAAFQVYQHVAKDLADLQQFQAGQVPHDSDPSYYHQALLDAQKEVAQEQTGLVSIQHGGSQTCAYIADFNLSFPPASQDTTLELPGSQSFPFTAQDQMISDLVGNSGISQRVQALSNAYQGAKGLPLPTIKGLRLPWLVVPGQPLTLGHRQVQALQAEIAKDAQQFTTAQGQATTIQAQVSALNQSTHCS